MHLDKSHLGFPLTVYRPRFEYCSIAERKQTFGRVETLLESHLLFWHIQRAARHCPRRPEPYLCIRLLCRPYANTPTLWRSQRLQSQCRLRASLIS